MASELKAIQSQLRALENPAQAEVLKRFFKTGPGEYGEGDRFLGIKVPLIRGLVRDHREFQLKTAISLLGSAIHEERLLALLLLVYRYEHSQDDSIRQQVFELYLGNTRSINNWDLVDLSAPNIVGAHLQFRPRQVLDSLARSQMLWERRIAIVATHRLIRLGQFDDTLRLASILRNDGEDLMHKAVGWMLREVGKRDRATLESFLRQHYQHMPRTMLRYAIEKFEEPRRQQYLKGRV